MNYILFGFKSCGKSFYGKKLAKHLGWEFVDTDKVIELLYKSIYLEKLNCSEIYKKLGSQGFRELEKKAIFSLKDKMSAVISVGGGGLLDPENVTFLLSLGRLFYLKVDKRTLKERIFSFHELPAFLDPLDPLTSFETIYKDRMSVYEKIPATCLDLDDKTEEEVIEEFLSLVAEPVGKH